MQCSNNCGASKLNDTGTNSGFGREGFSANTPRTPGSTDARFAFADGGVRFISDTIEQSMNANQRFQSDADNCVWERLIARQDGQAVVDF